MIKKTLVSRLFDRIIIVHHYSTGMPWENTSTFWHGIWHLESDGRYTLGLSCSLSALIHTIKRPTQPPSRSLYWPFPQNTSGNKEVPFIMQSGVDSVRIAQYFLPRTLKNFHDLFIRPWSFISYVQAPKYQPFTTFEFLINYELQVWWVCTLHKHRQDFCLRLPISSVRTTTSTGKNQTKIWECGIQRGPSYMMSHSLL